MWFVGRSLLGGIAVRGRSETIATRPVLFARGGRLLTRLTPVSAAELALLALIAVQTARLIWLLAAPLGPVGDWRATNALAPGDASALTGFDPFFRLSASGGPVTVTSLALKLYGVRQDQATGRGSAIIALPDGRQINVAVGEEIMPGVTLAEVGFDNVTISRGGANEQIFLDQSTPAQSVDVSAAPPPVTVAPVATPAAAPAPASGPPIGFAPRTANGRVNGVIVSAGGDGGAAFRAAGFEPGDVIVAINGQRISSFEGARAAIAQAGGEVNIMVDRGGRAVPLRVRLNQ
jgi:general secretion pathway protein C